ncbi:4Fe-4S binding protein [candidate division TA06 bacterium]|uniref:4Fe-4S binding protein n=1 Tax=candidate division TA06 bacterium TaxID=2250710 RepID=A0A933MKE0_UNCT6|nr:4Fe-4S binding protein [candidate division TA06 bacterium]
MISDKLKSTGLADAEDIQTVWSLEVRLKKGPVVIVECFQEIPCNPCETSCPQKAIIVGEDINALPRVDHSKCNGCAICVSRCPGLAIFVINENYSDTESAITMPCEFLPLPQKGDTVQALNREGIKCGQAKVIRVVNTKAQDKTPLVTLAIPKGREKEVRFFKLFS